MPRSPPAQAFSTTIHKRNRSRCDEQPLLGIQKVHTRTVLHQSQPERGVCRNRVDGCLGALSKKSLFQNILRAKYLLSIFCGDFTRSLTGKPLRINVLAASSKKILREISGLKRPFKSGTGQFNLAVAVEFPNSELNEHRLFLVC